MPAKNVTKRQSNRSKHYWQRINAASGRQKLREATDYIKALLAGHTDDTVVEAVREVEAIVADAVPRGGVR